MYTTQSHLSIADIQDDILLLKDGGGALVLQVSAVNFGLLSEREQVAIISSFAQMLNSLSFSIQIMIHSERLHITSYLELLDKAKKAQTNPLLSQMITQYKQFIQSTIKENEVLDKKFYIVIPLFALELGITASKERLEQKIKTVLWPRRDQIIRQLARVGLNADQLSRRELIEIFYDIYNSENYSLPKEVYNGEALEQSITQPVSPEQLAVRLKNPQPISVSQPTSSPISQSTNQIADTPTYPPGAPVSPGTPTITQSTRTHPFVVEELTE